ncbi:hypothetical protein [Roseovarius sp.]|uniref:hypothetical protein n=1 Tax=Roseovarius sp. TaxID=1486281 RepID=UPI000C4F3B02|nr:hypothetical protein [Roseovarius sp.]MAZ22360.1 hypothetical protein [Roseovarius sp.]
MSLMLRQVRAALTLLTVVLTGAAVLTPDIASAQNCVAYGASKYADAEIADIQTILSDGDEESVSGRLMERGALHFANPVSQLLLGIKAIETHSFEMALGHLDLASYLLWASELCAKKDLEFFVLASRKFALENGILEGFGAVRYSGMTIGLTNPSLEMVSQDFQKVRRCVEGLAVTPDSGVLAFPSC